MTNGYASTNSTASAELAADQGDCGDKKVLQALVAGALVALADLENVERDELIGFVHRQDFAPTISRSGIAKAFDKRVRELLEERYDPNLIIEALRPLADLSLTSVVVRTAQRVAAADRTIHPGEQQAIKLIRDHDEPAGKRVIMRRGLRPSHPVDCERDVIEYRSRGPGSVA
jgi:tellurite resistance protein